MRSGVTAVIAPAFVKGRPSMLMRAFRREIGNIGRVPGKGPNSPVTKHGDYE
jgi:hypothetical protein